MTQEHMVFALLNLSLHEENKPLISHAGAIKSLIYKNAACALLSLALVDDNKISIEACGVIPPLVYLLINGSNIGKKDALTTLYKLCSVRVNKERAVSQGGEATGGVSVGVKDGAGGEGDGGVGVVVELLLIHSYSDYIVVDGDKAVVRSEDNSEAIQISRDLITRSRAKKLKAKLNELVQAI
ncbi:hypothetical protein LguiA_022431 [Lonicera macranthoides]